MKKKTLLGIIATAVIVPVTACAILFNYTGVGVGDQSAYRDLAEIESGDLFLDNDMLALAASSETDANLAAMADEVIGLVNAERMASGLAPLQATTNLYQVAAIRAKEISISFSHTRPNGSPWYTVNSQIQGGENLAYGYGNATSVMDGWMNSPTHRENIMWPEFTKLAVAVYVADDGTYYWTQEFGY